MAVAVTALTTYFAGKPIWFIVVLSLTAGILSVCVASMISKSFALRVTENRKLKRLPRLVYDTHKRTNAVRERLIHKTNWEAVDTSKVISPLLNVFGSLEINDDKLSELHGKLSEAGSPPSGIASVPDAIMKGSDTSLERALRRDCRYRLLCTRLDGYQPYPTEAIGNMVSQIIHISLSINNALILQAYAPDPLSLETLFSRTAFSGVMRMRVYSTNVQAEDIVNNAVDKLCTKLSALIDDYLEKRAVSQWTANTVNPRT